MTILQSKLATGHETLPSSYESGEVVAYIADYTIATGVTVATSDIIELAVLPSGARIVNAKVIPTGNFGTSVTADIGIMSGDVGSTDSGRTSGAEVFDDVALTAMAEISKADALLLATTDKHRSIGVKFSGDVTGAGQVIRLQVFYAQ